MKISIHYVKMKFQGKNFNTLCQYKIEIYYLSNITNRIEAFNRQPSNSISNECINAYKICQYMHIMHIKHVN